jgi:hypothetical protein
MPQRLRGAEEGEPALLLLGEDLDRDPGGGTDLLGRFPPVLCLADRRGGDGADLLRAELLSEPHLGGDNLANFLDFLLGDPTLAIDRLADPRIGPLLHHLLQLPVDRLRDQQSRRVRTDVYGGAESHGRRPAMFPGQPDPTPTPSRHSPTKDAKRPRTPGTAR